MLTKIHPRIQSQPNYIQLNNTKRSAVLPNYKQCDISFTSDIEGKSPSLLNNLGKKCLNKLEAIKAHIPHQVFVFSGESGAGKSTIIGEIKKQFPSTRFFVSCTTRSPRPGEIDGKDYYFISKEKYEIMKNNNEFFDSLTLNDRSYGGSKEKLISQQMGENVIVDISADQAHKVKELLGKKAHLFFIKAPSPEAALARVINRGEVTEKFLEERKIYNAMQSKYIKDFDKILVNDDLKVAVKEATKWVKSTQSGTIKILNSLIKFLSKRVK